LYGSGSADDKSPVLGWWNVIEAHGKANINLLVNLLMGFEGADQKAWMKSLPMKPRNSSKMPTMPVSTITTVFELNLVSLC